MDIHRKSVDMDMDIDGKFHIRGKPVLLPFFPHLPFSFFLSISISFRPPFFLCMFFP